MPRLQEKICLGGIKMTKKLDNTAISTLKTEFEASYSTAETSLYEIFKALSVLTQSVNFRGAGAESHKLFLQEASLNYAYVLLEVTQTFKSYISEVEKGFLEYESEVSGKVNTDTVSEYKTSLSGIAKQIELLKSDLTSPESIARSHGVSIVSTGAGNLATQFSAIDSNLEKVNQDLADTDSSLKGKATTVSEAISNLKSSLDSVSSTYITSTGKYNTSTIGQLTKQDWYLKGNKDIFSDKQKSDPFVYNAGSASVLEGQYAVGLAKDTYLTTTGAVASGQYKAGIDGGEIYLKSNGYVLGGSLEVQATSAIEVTAAASMASGNVDLRTGKYGWYASGGASGPSAQGKVGIIDGLFSVSGQARFLFAEGTIGSYDNGEEFYYGFDASASLTEASANFDLFNVQIDGQKPVFAISAEPVLTGGGGATAAISGQSVYEDFLGLDWLDVDAVTFKVGGKAIIGGNISVTIPWPDLNF
ncbi:prophage function domain-containing protein [Streptococcus suis]|uniref:Prophage function domain-containing protein n=2 Tax=Streptococcus suis TaxID=1307 RepID=A0A116S244_STRSU|nr:prophage function domain-containing protein [Streptococcus suis]CYV20065.1 prophage function domain-containing protein [Streptococcus suis]CYV22425.1 prophage function domain-containing protein [Streptococcus suis]CYV29832.1 prophage function domain-containing protein [Streptococcus suis]CYX98836.1 prophage function domain-containing protein [Streptococcus suis]